MSIYDDTTDGSGTLVYGGHWCAWEPSAYRWSVGPMMREVGAQFFICHSCFCYLEAMDAIVGDFGDLHCVFCGHDTVSIDSDID